MILENDRVMLNWLNKFKIATATQLNEIAYHNMKKCYSRLNKLTSDSIIKKYKNTIYLGNLYTTTRIRTVSQVQHSLLRNDFYIKLASQATIEDCYVERVYGRIRPDAVISCIHNNKPYFFLLEVETNQNGHGINISKYNEFFLSDWKNYFNVKPLIIYVTEKQINKECSFAYKMLNTSLDNFEMIWE